MWKKYTEHLFLEVLKLLNLKRLTKNVSEIIKNF